MNQQMKIDNFYKFKVSKLLKFEMETPKKRSNTCLKPPSPYKTPKLEESDIIDLISEDEESQLDNENCSSDATVNYSPVLKSPISPSTSECFVRRTLSIKKDLFQSSSHNSDESVSVGDQSKSPITNVSRTRKKYYSPNKKRNVIIRSPGKARKNLNIVISESNDNYLVEACSGLDDKTIFVLKIIHQCLNNKDLKSLLDENSQKLLQNCMSVLKPGMHLVCKLYWRKAAWYRPNKIEDIFKKGNYAVDLKVMLSSLIQNGFLETNYSNSENNAINFNDCFNILKVNEVKEICQKFKIKFTTKEAAKCSLQKLGNQKSIGHYFGTSSQNNTQRVLASLHNKFGECYKLTAHTRKTFDELYTLMYLGIDWNILRDKTVELMLFNIKAKNEIYPAQDINVIDNASIVFKNRHEFQSFVSAKTIYEEFLNSSDALNRRTIVQAVYKMYLEINTEDMTSYMSLPVWLRNFTPPYLYVKILEKGLSDLKKPPEKEKHCERAVEILRNMVSQNAFRPHKKSEWIAEMALIYDKCLNNVDKAAETVLEGFTLVTQDHEKDCLRVRARMLTNRLTNRPAEELVRALEGYALQEPVERDIKATHVYKQAKESFDKGKIRFEYRLPDSTMVMDAEEYCRRLYIEEKGYTDGEHWEGAIVTTIFTLLFWDIIYAELRGARGIFISRYQKYPLDLFTECFYANRKCLIEERLSNIERKELGDVILSMKDVWDSRPECELSDIQRKRMCWDKIEAVCTCLGNRSIAAICRRLASDYRYYHSGFPDLTMWNVDTKQITFVEVKTDSDKPSIKQIQWMRYLQCANIETEFCYIGTNTTKSKARNVDS